MKVRRLRVEDHWKTRKLWERVFTEDTPEFLDYYYSVKTKENEIYVLEDGEEIVAMLHLNPYRMRISDTIYDTHYIVAVATDEQYRKRGFMRKLLHNALLVMEKRKEPLTFLMPASESIYKGFGFERIYEQASCEITGTSIVNAEFEVVPATEKDCLEMSRFANYHLRNYDIIVWRTEKYYQDLLKEYASENGGILLAKRYGKIKGICCYTKEGRLEIREPLFQEEMVLRQCIYHLTKDETIAVRCIGYGDKDKKPMIMAKILDPKLKIDLKKAKVFINEVV